MRLMLVDTASSGHHSLYLTKIASKILSEENELMVLATTNYSQLCCSVLSFPKKKNLVQYYFARHKWLSKVVSIVREFDPDLVHFLTGDSFYQLGGRGLNLEDAFGVLSMITLHHRPRGRIRQFLLRKTVTKSNALVVHTEETLTTEIIDTPFSERYGSLLKKTLEITVQKRLKNEIIMETEFQFK